jgi:hypothetical protein
MLILRFHLWAILSFVLAALTVNAEPTSTATTYEFHSARGQLLLEYTPSENEQTTEHIYLGDKRIAQRSFNDRSASTRTCAFEISGDGDVDAGIDGLLIARYALIAHQ